MCHSISEVSMTMLMSSGAHRKRLFVDGLVGSADWSGGRTGQVDGVVGSADWSGRRRARASAAASARPSQPPVTTTRPARAPRRRRDLSRITDISGRPTPSAPPQPPRPPRPGGGRRSSAVAGARRASRVCPTCRWRRRPSRRHRPPALDASSTAATTAGVDRRRARWAGAGA